MLLRASPCSSRSPPASRTGSGCRRPSVRTSPLPPVFQAHGSTRGLHWRSSDPPEFADGLSRSGSRPGPLRALPLTARARQTFSCPPPPLMSELAALRPIDHCLFEDTLYVGLDLGVCRFAPELLFERLVDGRLDQSSLPCLASSAARFARIAMYCDTFRMRAACRSR